MATLLQRFKRLAPYFTSSKRGFAVAIAASLASALTEPALPALLKPLLDNGFGRSDIPLWLIPVAIVSLFVVRAVAGFTAQYALAWAANQGVLNLRASMFEHLLTAQPGLFSKHSASNLTNTLVYEVQQGASMLVIALLALIRDSLIVLALLSYLLYLNWKLTLFVAVVFPVVFLVVRVISKRLHRLTVAAQQATDELAYVIEENVLAWRIVRLHDAAAQQTERFVTFSQLLRRLMMKSVAAATLVSPVTYTLMAAALSAVIVVALMQNQSGDTTVGGFAAFVTAMLLLLAPIKHLSDVMGPITRGLAALERGQRLIDDSPLEQGGHHDPGTARGEIELRDVSLRYAHDKAPALDRLSLHVRPGQTVALVGPSGAGKSSLVHLLPRFVEPSSGSVLLDGVPLPEWNVVALRRQFALVSQDVVLFNDSIANNVSLRLASEREKVLAALRDANLSDFVATLPEGIDTLIGHNGSQLSGGQRQRLAIARAIYKNAPVLILDEATSALDSESERAVQDALVRLMQGRTTLVIAHRLSTIEHADRVVAMEAGRVVEQGSHAQLLADGGLYARLRQLQFGKATGDDT
ncbi:MAG: lipid A export permease/ATP-binding protein MsbA [Rubrivivax sp.]